MSNTHEDIKNPFSSPLKDFLTEAEETALYEQAATEIENGIMNKGLWAKALSKADGNEEKQKAIYIELLVDYFKKEIAAGKELASILAREEEIESKRNKETIKPDNETAEDPKESKAEAEKAARQKKYLEEEEAQKKDVEEFMKELKEKAEKMRNRIKNR